MKVSAGARIVCVFLRAANRDLVYDRTEGGRLCCALNMCV